MAFRPDILAGRAVILVSVQDNLDKQFRSMRARIRRFSNSVGDIGGNLFRAGAVGVAGSIFPVKEFIEFQDQLLFIQTKLQVTDQEMIGLEKTIRDLGKSTSFTSTEVGQAAQQLAQAGFSLQEVQSSLQASLDLARGGGVDLSTATSILANNLRTFGANADQASIFASKFITAARLGTLDIIDLNESLKESSGTFRLLGVGLDEALGLIAQLSLSSLKGTKAGTSLNTAFLNLASSADILNEKLGITFTDAELQSPLAIFAKLQDAISRLGRQETVDVLRGIFNIRGGRAAGAILIQGLDTLDDRLRQIRGSFDEARVSATKLDSRLGGGFRRSLSAFQEFLLAAGSTSEGPLGNIFERLAKGFNELSTLSQSNPKFVQTLLIIPPVALAAGAGLLVFGSALNLLASAFTPVIALSGLLFTNLARFVGLQKTIGGGIAKGVSGILGGTSLQKLTKKQRRINSSLGKAGAGTGNRTFLRLLVLVKSIGKAFARIPLSVRNFFAILKSTISPLRKIFGFTAKTSTAIRKGSIFRVDVIRKVFVFFTKIGSVLRGIFFTLNNIRRFAFSFSGIFTILELLIIFGPKIPPIRRALEATGNALKSLFKDVSDVIKSTLPAIEILKIGFSELFKGNLENGVNILKTGFKDLVSIIGTGLVNAWDKFRRLIDPVADKIRRITSGLLQTVTSLIQTIGIVGGFAASRIGGGIGSLLPEGSGSGISIDGFFAGVIGAIKAIGIQLIKFIGVVSNIANLIKQAVFALLSAISVLPGGKEAADTLDRFDTNRPRRDQIQAQLAPLLLELQRASTIGDAPELVPVLRTRITELQKELASLGPAVGSVAFNVAQAITELNNLPVFQPGNSFLPSPGASGEASSAIANANANLALIQGKLAATALVNSQAVQQSIQEIPLIKLLNTLSQGLSGGQTQSALSGNQGKQAEQLERTLSKLTSVTGSFAGTRGQLLKLAEGSLDKDRNELIKAGNEQLANIEKKLEFNFA